MANTKRQLFLKRRMRVRNKLRKMANGRPRLSVHRSGKNMSVQIIVGAEIATRAKKAGVEVVYFDRGGFLFHGKVKALADAAREGGLKF